MRIDWTGVGEAEKQGEQQGEQSHPWKSFMSFVFSMYAF